MGASRGAGSHTPVSTPMCVIALAWRAHPDWFLVVAANRDEAHDRPTADLDAWPVSDIVAGRDLRSGGSWLGVSGRQPRFAGVTNVASPHPRNPDAASRGGLVQGFLETGAAPEADASGMNPFNLVLATDHQAMLVTNHPGPSRRILQPGVHGISNGAASDEWPATGRLKQAVGQTLTDALNTTEAVLDGLMGALDDREPGRGTEPEDLSFRRLFLQNPVYGTRCSTIVAVDRLGRGRIRERRFDAGGTTTGETERTFSWPL